MLSLSLDAARAAGGPATPAAGGALLAAGYDRDSLSSPAAESRHGRWRGPVRSV